MKEAAVVVAVLTALELTFEVVVARRAFLVTIGLAAMLLFGTSALAANKPVTVMLKDKPAVFAEGTIICSVPATTARLLA